MARPEKKNTTDEVIPSLRDEQREFTRRKLVAAGRVVFARAGYRDATVGDITAEANVNRATFYLHFTNKSEVFRSVVQETYEDAIKYWTMLDKALLEGTPEAVRGWLETAVGWWDDNADLLPAHYAATAAEPEIATLWRETVDRLAVELHGYLGKFALSERNDAKLRVEFLIMQLDQVYFAFQIQQIVTVERDHLLNLLADMWCASLRIS